MLSSSQSWNFYNLNANRPREPISKCPAGRHTFYQKNEDFDPRADAAFGVTGHITNDYNLQVAWKFSFIFNRL
jgi:hypothetical protein